MKIINKPTVSYKQCENWIKSKRTANVLALENLPIMWNAAVENGIDPAVLIAQSMLETGWYNFGGVVPASYHNPCGLKITKGGGCQDVGAHMRFFSWEDGIMAQSDHLALYAGGPTVPKYSPECASHQNSDKKANGTTKDPRHFTYLYGKCPTVESLSGNWAMSKTYGNDIIKMINEIKSMPGAEPVQTPMQQEIARLEETIKQLEETIKDPVKSTVNENVNALKKQAKNIMAQARKYMFKKK